MTQSSLFDGVDRGAVFSPDGQYRYRLWRQWGDGPTLVFVMLNPSTADAETNDPTVARCEKRAITLGYGRLEVLNVFAFRSTDPRALKVKTDDPVGPENDQAITDVVTRAVQTGGMVVAAWGKHASLLGRGKAVAALLRSLGANVQCLGQNEDGSPVHPLYQPDDALLWPLIG